MTDSNPGSNKPLRTRTPCVGRCSTTYGDLVCRGCKRFAHEVVGWNGYTDAQRDAVWARLLTLLEQIVGSRVEVFDRGRLHQQLARHRIRFDPGDDDAFLVFLLLRRGARHMRRLEAYGIRARMPLAGASALELRNLIDDDYQRLSEAHYERFFSQPTQWPAC